MSQSPTTSSETSNTDNSGNSSQSRFPQTILAVSTEEFIEPVELTIRDGDGNTAILPNDLHGNFLVVGPSGSPDSSTVDEHQQVAWVSKDGWTPLYNGDGLIYRINFNNGSSNLKTRFVRPPCYYADHATAAANNSNNYEGLKFQNLGIARTSINKLGLRNQVNTAFVPFKLPEDESPNAASDRLLVTWDIGRPYEIDPETLETLNPLGENQDWLDLLPNQQPAPFKQVMSTAHPVFDSETGDLYTVNVGKSIWTLLAFPRSLKERLAENALSLKSIINDSAISAKLQDNFIKLYSLFLSIVKLLISFLGLLEKISRTLRGGYDFVHLMVWDGKQVGIKGKWNIVLPGSRPLKIDQTVHQMGLTKDYLVFAETSFKFSLENILAYQKNYLATAFKVLLADFIDYPQYPTTKLFVVKRSDLAATAIDYQKSPDAASGKSRNAIPKVVAKEVELAPEFSHFIVDYENPNNQIVAYVDHLAATDVAEYIRIFDRSAFDNRDRDDKKDKYDDPDLTTRTQKLAGSVVSPMDASRIGRCVIDGETGKVVDKQLVSDIKLNWSTAFYVCPDQRPTMKYTDIFWNSWGCWPDTLTERNVAAYERYSERLVPVEEVLDITYKGVPSSLCHLKIRTDSNNKTKIEIDPDNYYLFNNHYLGTSAQFIPRPNAEDQTDGYIACVVLTSDEFLSQSTEENNDPEWSQNSEIWIFDARKLAQGPLYKLSHPKLNIGFTIHSSWIAQAKSPSQHLDYDVREDHEYLVQQLIKNEPELGEKIRQLFDEEIYPNFD